jgi:short-subunit dehydrogenase
VEAEREGIRSALVTGASSGLGADFARQLAARGVPQLVLVARRRERLHALADELSRQFGCEATCIALDLTADGVCDELNLELDRRGIEIDVLINNAGVGLYGPFVDNDVDRLQQMLQLDVLVPAQLTRSFAAKMVTRGFGYILQVASIAAQQPAPYYAAYSGAKAFVLSFSEALAVELRGTGVSCTVLCPGVTRTGFFEAAQQDSLSWYQRLTMMDSASAARRGIDAMLARRVVQVPGVFNQIAMWVSRWLPRRWMTALAGRVVRG